LHPGTNPRHTLAATHEIASVQRSPRCNRERASMD
jgi:hypothetical protein